MSSGAVSRRVLGTLALVALAVLIALGGMEAALRVAGIGSDQLLQQDPVLGVRYIPGKRGLIQNSCYRATPTINSHGWRSPETTWEKPAGVYRIVVLGDSFMGALQVEDDQTFAAVLEERLNRMDLGTRIEVINLGVPSFGNDQELLSLRHFGKKYDPDFVILAFYGQNDVNNNSMTLDRRYSAYPKPFFDVEDGRLVELPYRDPTPTWIALARRLVQPLRLYPWTLDTLMAIPAVHRVLFDMGIVGVKPSEDARAKEAGRFPGRWETQSLVFRRSYDAEWEHAWDITRALLRQTRDEAGKMGAGFLLLGLSDPLAVIPPSVLADEMPADALAGLDPDKPTRLVRTFASAAGIDFYSLIPDFRRKVGDSVEAFEEYYLACDGHFTPAGHRLAADSVAAVLAPMLKARIAQ